MNSRVTLLMLTVVMLFAFTTEKKQWVAIEDSITYLNDLLLKRWQ
ncbi:hypothetical protein [Arcicella rosea]|uniref:Uncharacterized protein n=1 Tax=Arcicella rosea TaxID=502909 RepID=A0A841EQK2_9BACT|nr:hypothetical protein [Arcicella rosea]MBB6002550.1 hypothetical protein [Arcicella rosea]